jgi:RNA-directed DNA polymerase
MLGIPTVKDRVIQQAVAQVLTPIFDPTFSESSFGFRPGRNAHQAIRQVQRHVKGGRSIAMGTPQGGPLSPLLANILLHQLDIELERRGHRFARYADDMVILVKSERAAQRVMGSITRYLETTLKLKVNLAKSKVAPMSDCAGRARRSRICWHWA